MKRFKRLIIAWLMGCMLLTGCGSKSEDTATTAAAAAKAEASTEKKTESTEAKDAAPAVQENDANWYFLKDGVKIEMYAPADPVIEALGAYNGTKESPSCAFDGMDIVYIYPGFDLYAFDDGSGNKVITQLVLRDDTVQTREGAYIGMDIGHVEKMYTAVEDGKNSLSMTRGNCTLLIIFKDGVVSSIQYSAKIDE